jgi:hypothetical protein
LLQILCWAAGIALIGMAGIYFYLMSAIPPKTFVERFCCKQCGKVFFKSVEQCDVCQAIYPPLFKVEEPASPNPIHYVLCIGLAVAGIAIILIANGQANSISNIRF